MTYFKVLLRDLIKQYIWATYAPIMEIRKYGNYGIYKKHLFSLSLSVKMPSHINNSPIISGSLLATSSSARVPLFLRKKIALKTRNRILQGHFFSTGLPSMLSKAYCHSHFHLKIFWASTWVIPSVGLPLIARSRSPASRTPSLAEPTNTYSQKVLVRNISSTIPLFGDWMKG